MAVYIYYFKNLEINRKRIAKKESVKEKSLNFYQCSSNRANVFILRYSLHDKIVKTLSTIQTFNLIRNLWAWLQLQRGNSTKYPG